MPLFCCGAWLEPPCPLVEDWPAFPAFWFCCAGASGAGPVSTLVRVLGRRATLCRAAAAPLARGCTTLRATHARQSERCDGLIVDTAAHLEALSPLEGADCRHGPRTHPAVDHNIEPSLLKHGLDLPDL